MLPKISIVTPSFNQGRFLEQTIQSVLDQRYPNLEYIVIDGGSTDDSVSILRRYDSRLTYWVSEPDRGAADAIRKGFDRSTGSILAYLNSDDIYLPGTFAAIAAVLNSETDVVYGNTYWIDANGERIGERRQTPFHPSGYLYGAFDLQQPATFWTRSVYTAAGGINPDFKFAFDTDLFFRFVSLRARFQHIPRFLASFRIHEHSKSTNELDRCRTEVELLRKKHLRHPIDSVAARVIRTNARVHRAWSYARQGELGWLIGRIPDRWKSRRSTEIVGPRAKWI